MMYQKPFKKYKSSFYKKMLYIFIGFCLGLVFFNALRVIQNHRAGLLEEADAVDGEANEEHKAMLTYDQS